MFPLYDIARSRKFPIINLTIIAINLIVGALLLAILPAMSAYRASLHAGLALKQ